MRLRRPPQSTIDQVHISREGDYAVIEHADTNYGTIRLHLGSTVNNLSDAEILVIFNEIISAQEASVVDPANRPVEIPRGRPQIEWLEDLQQWTARGHVLRGHLSDDEDGSLVFYIDDKELDAGAFLDLISPFAGWGFRITFMDETQVYDEPSVIVRDPDDSD